MDKPSTHYFHVNLEIKGLKAEYVDLKLPNWTPGYYRLMDYARHVINFSSKDARGNYLDWAKKAKNIWRIKTRGATKISVAYDVYAFNASVAESFLDDRRAYVVPANVFMYPNGYLQNPIKLALHFMTFLNQPFSQFSQ